MARVEQHLAGKLAVVTGGARGIGRATAEAMIRSGMRVAIGDLDVDKAGAAASELGRSAAGYSLDVTDLDGFGAFLDQVEADLGPIDVLVNNAGIMQVARFLDESPATTQRMIAINVLGVTNGSRLILPRFVSRGGGHLVNVASSAGRSGYPGFATYTGTKAFVIGFSESLRGELLDTAVNVSVVMPGPVKTELSAGVGQARGFSSSDPSAVADGIVGALKHPHFDVFVPKVVGPLTAVNRLLPRALQDLGAKLTRADRLGTEAAAAPERRAYETRAGQSGPAVVDPQRAPSGS